MEERYVYIYLDIKSVYLYIAPAFLSVWVLPCEGESSGVFACEGTAQTATGAWEANGDWLAGWMAGWLWMSKGRIVVIECNTKKGIKYFDDSVGLITTLETNVEERTTSR